MARRVGRPRVKGVRRYKFKCPGCNKVLKHLNQYILKRRHYCQKCFLKAYARKEGKEGKEEFPHTSSLHTSSLNTLLSKERELNR